jgi:hypothetical protein
MKWLADKRPVDKFLAELEEAAAKAATWVAEGVAKATQGGDRAAAAAQVIARHAEREHLRARHALWVKLAGVKRKPIPELPLAVDLLRLIDGSPTAKAQIAAQAAVVKAELVQWDNELVRLSAIVQSEEQYYAFTAKGGNWLHVMHQRILDSLQVVMNRFGSASGQIPFRAWADAQRTLQVAQLPNYAHPTRGPMELVIDGAAHALREHARCSAKLAALERNSKRSVEVVAQRVQAAIESAGRERVVSGCMAAELLSNQISAALTAKAQARKAAEDELRKHEEKLARFLDLGITGEVTANTRANLEAVSIAVQAVRADFDREHRKLVEGLIDAAQGGGEEARAVIEALAQRQPDMFGSVFLHDIANARFDRAILLETAQAFTAK